MYLVIRAFADSQDELRVYEVGDTYKGKTTKKRIEELSTTRNKRKQIFIEKVDADDEE